MEKLEKITKDRTTGKKRQWTLRIVDAESSFLYWQPINKKTGRGWQATRDVQAFYGKNAEIIGKFAFLKADIGNMCI